MKTLMTFLMTCAVFGMMSASAMAGGEGGGSKDDGTIVVKNDAAAPNILLVGVNLTTPIKLTTFLAQGGKVVAPGATASFKVKAGTVKVGGIFVGDENFEVTGTQNAKDYNLAKKATINVSATIVEGATTFTP